MNDHLTSTQLSALADGELAADDLNAVKQHIDECLPCARSAVDQWLLKGAVAKAGLRHDLPQAFRDQMAALVAEQASTEARRPNAKPISSQGATSWGASARWALAAVLLLTLGSWGVLRYRENNSLNAERAALVTEASDLHIAMLSANQPPQVISSDRHTVKPWFQGKLPFAFNLPETLPADTTLDGANLAYLHNRPVAQLLFSIGRHRVSVFVEQKLDGSTPGILKTAHEGFNLDSFESDHLEVIAVSDVDPARLSNLSTALEAAQVYH